MFSFKATFAQMHGTRTHKNNKTGEIITVSYRENIGQKIKNIVFEPHYYTKKIIVKDSLGQLKWHFKLKSHAFGCERAIGSNYYKLVLYNSDNTRTMMKTRRIAYWRRTTIK